jgi:tight adherence protein C
MNINLVIPILAGLAVFLVGLSIVLSRWNYRAPLRTRLDGVSGGAAVAGALSAAPGLGVTDVIANVGSVVSSGKSSKNLREQLTQAGYHSPNAAAVYIGVKILLLICGLTGGAALVLSTSLSTNDKLLIVGAAAIVPFLTPNAIVASHCRARRRSIRRNLPDAVDLLEICTSAGMGIDQAWNAVAERVREVNPNLADEMALTNLEIHLGASRVDAMRHMATRTGAEELSSLVAVLVQSERFGTSLSEAFQEFSRYMRESRSQGTQESAEKMAVKLIFPMVLFIFPAVVLVMAGPAFITLYHVLRTR